MSSYVSIANRAATAVGTSATLTAPGDDTVLGRAVASVWDVERRAVLREGEWNFAVKREAIPALSDKPLHGYDAQFHLPTDCLRLLEVHGMARTRYRREGDAILADTVGPLDIRYIRDVAEPAKFDPDFAQAFALRIALAIGNKIAGSAFDKRTAWNLYREAVNKALGADAMENPPIEQEESDWVTARFHGSSAGMGTWVDGGA